MRGWSNNVKVRGVQNWGATVAIISTVDYFGNFGDKNGYEHASYFLGMVTYGVAFINPVGVGVAVIYGALQLGSYIYNGKTLEENIGKSLGF